MSESYFAKLANDILDASEKLTIRVEEGLNVLWNELEGNRAAGGGSTAQPPPETMAEHEFEDLDQAEGMDESSPLAGIAESVMEDIMASQVSTTATMTTITTKNVRTLTSNQRVKPD